MNLRYHNHRFANELLASPPFAAHFDELQRILRALPAIRRGSPKSLKSPSSNNPVDQDAMNSHLDEALEPLGWEHHPGGIISGTRLEADYSKGRIQVEVQFGNMARWTYDVFKFQAAYAKDRIDIGILVVPIQWFAKTIGDNIVYFERIRRELPAAKLSITLPILVIGLDPDDDVELAPHRGKYEREARLDEQWTAFLDTWSASLPQPISFQQLSELLFAPQYAHPEHHQLQQLLPEDARQGLGVDEKVFARHLDKALKRRRALKRLDFTGGGRKRQLRVIEALEED
jgi:hypothetical protein